MVVREGALERVGVAVVAAGDFPRAGGEARAMLDEAQRVVCCDGAADAFMRETGREPDAVVGDGDSVRGDFKNFVRINEQDTSDLEKAVRWCVSHGWGVPVVFGATGGREDHFIGNVFRAFALGVDIVTDYGRFCRVEGRSAFMTRRGAAVSVFATDPAAAAKSSGLEWPLDGVKFANLYVATLNRASAERVEIETTAPLYVYFES
jgi:thiamine pyrophosphokinase